MYDELTFPERNGLMRVALGKSAYQPVVDALVLRGLLYDDEKGPMLTEAGLIVYGVHCAVLRAALGPDWDLIAWYRSLWKGEPL